VHYPNPVGNNKPITIGHNYAALVHVDLAGPSTWAPPWALERTPTNWRGVDLALEQIVHLVRCDDEWHVVAADSRYGTPSYIAGLHQCPNVTGVTRLRSPRNVYRKAPPYSGFGRPRVHGDVFKLHDATTWGEPDERTEFTEQDAKGRSLRVVIEAWQEMHFCEAPHCPFTVVKITTYRANGQLRFKHPLWLAVVNRRGLSLKEIRAIYLRRPVIEHFNRLKLRRWAQSSRTSAGVKWSNWPIGNCMPAAMWSNAMCVPGSGTSHGSRLTSLRRRAKPDAASADFCSIWAHQPVPPSSVESRPAVQRAIDQSLGSAFRWFTRAKNRLTVSPEALPIRFLMISQRTRCSSLCSVCPNSKCDG